MAVEVEDHDQKDDEQDEVVRCWIYHFIKAFDPRITVLNLATTALNLLERTVNVAHLVVHLGGEKG